MGQTIAQRFEVLRTKQDLSLEDSIRFRNFCDKHAIDACVHCAFHAACNLIADYMEFCDIDENADSCDKIAEFFTGDGSRYTVTEDEE